MSAMRRQLKMKIATQCLSPSFGNWEWDTTNSSRLCVDNAIARAVADVNAPMLTRYSMARSRQTIRLAEKQ
jgi:hypothetical protein